MPDQLQNHEAAGQGLIERVRVPAILHKLASWGIHPRNQDEADQLVALTNELRATRLNEQVKTAAAGGNPFFARALDSARQINREDGVGSYDSVLAHKEAAAATLSEDPQIAKDAAAWLDYLDTLQAQGQQQAGATA